ncbi:MAG: DivIVA domain-containing protein [Streptosporangiaceae bacterium]
MGIHEVTGTILIANGTIFVSRGLARLVRARRSGARSAAIPTEIYAALLVGLGSYVGGVLYLLYPRYPRGTRLSWIPLLAAGLILLIVPWFMPRRRARRLGPISTYTLDLRSAALPGPRPSIAPDAHAASLIERIENVKFSTVRLVHGYDEAEVDAFLDRLVACLSEDGRVDRSELRDTHFSRTLLRPGYAMPDVDTFIEEVAQATS